jgi:hypothetical protein
LGGVRRALSIAACAFFAPSGEAPEPARGFDIRIAA